MQIVGTPIVASGTKRRRLDDAQDLEEEEEVPLRPRRVGRRRRVGLRPELGARAIERQRDDRDHDDAAIDAVLGDRVGEERLALRLQDRVLAEVLLLLALVHAGASRLVGSHVGWLAELGASHATAGPWCRAWPRGRGARRSARRSARASAACGSRRSATAWSPRTRARRAGSRRGTGRRAGPVPLMFTPTIVAQ